MDDIFTIWSCRDIFAKADPTGCGGLLRAGSRTDTLISGARNAILPPHLSTSAKDRRNRNPEPKLKDVIRVVTHLDAVCL